MANLIPSEHLPTCKMGQGAECCRYLVFDGGFACAKTTAMRYVIDGKVASMTAQGDNCAGWPQEDS